MYQRTEIPIAAILYKLKSTGATSEEIKEQL